MITGFQFSVLFPGRLRARCQHATNVKDMSIKSLSHLHVLSSFFLGVAVGSWTCGVGALALQFGSM